MLKHNLPVVQRRVRVGLYRAQELSRRLWVRILAVLVIIFLLSQKQFSIQFQLGEAQASVYSSEEAPRAMKTSLLLESPTRGGYSESKESPKTVKRNVAPSAAPWWETLREESHTIAQTLNLANPATAVGAALTEAQKAQAAKYSNLGLILSPQYIKKHKISPAIVAYKRRKCLDYIATYKATAQEEARLFNIPAAITLAQGLLESNAGDSKLAKRDNNHFGIKCKKKCVGCRCANYTDDSRYDMFRIYESAWRSFRSHSKLLQNARYKHLLDLPSTDYKNWAYGLQAAGYATDKKYADKLIQIIEAFRLYEYDRP